MSPADVVKGHQVGVLGNSRVSAARARDPRRAGPRLPTHGKRALAGAALGIGQAAADREPALPTYRWDNSPPQPQHSPRTRSRPRFPHRAFRFALPTPRSRTRSRLRAPLAHRDSSALRVPVPRLHARASRHRF